MFKKIYCGSIRLPADYVSCCIHGSTGNVKSSSLGRGSAVLQSRNDGCPRTCTCPQRLARLDYNPDRSDYFEVLEERGKPAEKILKYCIKQSLSRGRTNSTVDTIIIVLTETPSHPTRGGEMSVSSLTMDACTNGSYTGRISANAFCGVIDGQQQQRKDGLDRTMLTANRARGLIAGVSHLLL